MLSVTNASDEGHRSCAQTLIPTSAPAARHNPKNWC